MIKRFCSIPAVALALLGAAGCWAGTVNVSVQDANGRPAADAVVLLEPVTGKAPVKPGPPVDVKQEKRTFIPRVTVVTVGTPVNFPNFDTVRHHVYSFAPVKFDIKLYVGRPEKPIVFDKPGVAIMGCNIHDLMAAWIVVAETPWHGQSGADGRIKVDNVPPGDYRLRVWHPALPVNTEAPVALVKVTAAELNHATKLSVSAGP